MRHVLWVALFLLWPAASHADKLGVYSDMYGFSCLIHDTPGIRTLYVLHKLDPGTVGSRFRIEYSPGFTGVLASFSSPFAGASGDPLLGVTINYGTCEVGDILIMELGFVFMGGSPECSWVRVAAHPLSVDGNPDVYDCYVVRKPAGWGGTHIQIDFGQYCPEAEFSDAGFTCTPYTPPLATESMTWGAVKALYR